MKNLRKILPVALMAMTLCSCGGGVDVTNKHLPTDDPSKEVVIQFWHCMGHDKSENLGKIVKKFNEQYAGKYRVEATAPEKTYDKLHETVMTRISTGEVPALCMGYPDSFSMYITKNLETSHIYKLDNFFNDENYGYSAEEKADFVDAFLEEGPVTQIPQPRHPGIQLDMHLQTAPQTGSGFGVFQCLGKSAGGLGQGVIEQDLRIFGRCVPEDQNGNLNPAVAELNGFIKTADGEILSPETLQKGRDPKRPVTIGVCLYHAEKTAAFRKLRADCMIIVPNGGEVNLCPGSFGKISHILPLYNQIRIIISLHSGEDDPDFFFQMRLHHLPAGVNRQSRTARAGPHPKFLWGGAPAPGGGWQRSPPGWMSVLSRISASKSGLEL